MIDIETLTRLKMMRLSGMAEYFENLADTPTAATMTGPELVKQAVDWEYERRRDSKLHRLRRQAGLAQPGADLADLKAMPGRSVDSELIARLAIGSYLVKRQDVILQGPTGAGKTYVACALANKACQQYRKVLYLSAGELFDRITIAERTGDKKRCLDALVKVELLIIDDWFLTPTPDCRCPRGGRCRRASWPATSPPGTTGRTARRSSATRGSPGSRPPCGGRWSRPTARTVPGSSPRAGCGARPACARAGWSTGRTPR